MNNVVGIISHTNILISIMCYYNNIIVNNNYAVKVNKHSYVVTYMGHRNFSILST